MNRSGLDCAEDLFEATRMPLGEHIEDLRRCLVRALAGFAVAVALGFYASPAALEFLTAPVVRELDAFQHRRQERVAALLAGGDAEMVAANQPREVELLVRADRLRRLLGLPEGGGPEWEPVPVRLRPVDWALATGEAVRRVGRPPGLAVFAATEGFSVYFKVSLYCGFVLASPWIFYQLWRFIAAGLYRHEKRRVYFFLPLSLGLFLGGVALGEFVVLPVGLRYLLGFNEWLGFEPELRLSDWLNFALLVPLVFGAAFQTPLVMLVLDRLGIVGAESFRRHRRLAIFLLSVLAAVLTVTPDPINMLALAVPLWALYEVGILLCGRGRDRAGSAAEGAEELAQV
jgi:sec-independent protein translocase protein TatC